MLANYSKKKKYSVCKNGNIISNFKYFSKGSDKQWNELKGLLQTAKGQKVTLWRTQLEGVTPAKALAV